MDFLLSEELNLPMPGEIRTGRVVEHRNKDILVDIGAKSEGIIAGPELESMDRETREKLAVGNEVLVCVIDPEDQDGNLVLSYTRAIEEQDWERASELIKSKEVCEAVILGFNRGGALVKFRQLRGFVPRSQLLREHRFMGQPGGGNGQPNIVGKTISAKIIEADRDRNRLILSERAASQEIRDAKRAQLLSELKAGDIRDGRVVNLADFGAFVDIGGIEGLVHLSELSWKRVKHPSEKLQPGDEVKVYVLDVDEERQRLALSLKRLEPDPWTLVAEHYSVGQLVEATITKLAKFGAFAQLDDEYELVGLIHISEMSEDHVDHPREVVKPSQVVTVRIIRIDPEQRQLGLSMKQVTSGDFIEADMAMLSATDESSD